MRRTYILVLAVVVLSLAAWGALVQPARAAGTADTESGIAGAGTVATNAREGVLINIGRAKAGPRLGANDGGQCTGVLVTTPNVTPSGVSETRAVLTAGHCIYGGAGQPADVHFDVGAPYAPENAVHPAFGLKVVHSVDNMEGRRWMAEAYPDFYAWNGLPAFDGSGNLLNLHDVGLICLDQPVRTELPLLDTQTVIQPLNTTQSGRATIVAVGRVNNVDPRYPPGLGKYQDLFRTNNRVTGTIREQDLGSGNEWVRNEFIVPSAPPPPIEDGDSGGPAFVAGTHTVVGVNQGGFFGFDQAGAQTRWAVGFSRLSDPAVASWLKTGINGCNNGRSHSLPPPRFS